MASHLCHHQVDLDSFETTPTSFLTLIDAKYANYHIPLSSVVCALIWQFVYRRRAGYASTWASVLQDRIAQRALRLCCCGRNVCRTDAEVALHEIVPPDCFAESYIGQRCYKILNKFEITTKSYRNKINHDVSFGKTVVYRLLVT